MKHQGVVRSPTGRAGRASTEPASSLGHTATIPSAARIPHGLYCYENLSPMDSRGHMKINGLCPYWESRGPRKAYCRYLDEEDEILLWDQCKICGVNDHTETPASEGQ